jgi:hypothetical protein
MVNENTYFEILHISRHYSAGLDMAFAFGNHDLQAVGNR